MRTSPRFAAASLIAPLPAIIVLLLVSLIGWVFADAPRMAGIGFIFAPVLYLGLCATSYAVARSLFFLGRLTVRSLFVCGAVGSLAIAAVVFWRWLSLGSTLEHAALSFLVFFVLGIVTALPTVHVWWKVASNRVVEIDARQEQPRALHHERYAARKSVPFVPRELC